MAVIAVTREKEFIGGVIYKWETLTENDTAAAAAVPSMAVGSVSATGTWGGGVMVLQGSIDGGTTWVALNDLDGTAVSINADGGATMSCPFLMIRPHFTTAGTSRDVDVLIAVKEEPKRHY